MIKKYIVLLSFLLSQDLAFAQDSSTENKIRNAVQGAVNSHRFRIGFIRFQPTLSAGSGYDSNALIRADDVIGDYYFTAVPGVSAITKFGNRAFLQVNEDLVFLYYKELEERRDIYNTTNLRFVTGTARLLATFSGAYISRESRQDAFEFDEPIQEKTTRFGVGLQYALSLKMDLLGAFDVTKTNYEQEIDTEQPPPADRDTLRYGMGFNYLWKPNVHFGGSVVFGHTDFEDQAVRNFWYTRGWTTIQQRQYSAHFSLGYGVHEQSDLSRRHHWLANMHFDWLIRRKVRLGGFFSRSFQSSLIVNDSFTITTRGGPTISFPVFKDLMFDANYTIGQNEYEEPTEPDRFQSADAALSYPILGNLRLRAGVNWYKRESDDFDDRNKERTAFIIGVSYTTDFGGPAQSEDDVLGD